MAPFFSQVEKFCVFILNAFSPRLLLCLSLPLFPGQGQIHTVDLLCEQSCTPTV